MPNKPLIPCRATGCAALVTSGYCDAHRALAAQSWRDYDRNKRRSVATLANAADIRSTSQWQKVRKLHRAMYPLCCDPFKTHGDTPKPNQQSHHVLPLAERPDLAFVLANLAPLCTQCHSRTEQLERQGKPTAYLFGEYQASPSDGPALG